MQGEREYGARAPPGWCPAREQDLQGHIPAPLGSLERPRAPRDRVSEVVGRRCESPLIWSHQRERDTPLLIREGQRPLRMADGDIARSPERPVPRDWPRGWICPDPDSS